MTSTITRRRLKARDIPTSWQVDLPEDPETLVEVTVPAAPGVVLGTDQADGEAQPDQSRAVGSATAAAIL